MKSVEPVEEIAIRLEAGGLHLVVWTASPGRPVELALGRLVAAGYHEPGEPLPAFEVETDGDVVVVRVGLPGEALARGQAEAAHRRERGCGLLHFVECEPERIAGRPRDPLPEADWPALFQELYGAGGSRPSGLHAAAASDGRGLLHRVDEVGRHNAVDKVVGAALLAGDRPGRLGLVVSSRVSGEIALKAARAGLAWLATRSVPTTLALRIAKVAGVPIVARAVGPGRWVYGTSPGGGDNGQGDA